MYLKQTETLAFRYSVLLDYFTGMLCEIYGNADLLEIDERLELIRQLQEVKAQIENTIEVCSEGVPESLIEKAIQGERDELV